MSEWRVTETATAVHVEHLDKGGFAVVSQQAGEWACTFLNTLEAEVERLREELEGIVNFDAGPAAGLSAGTAAIMRHLARAALDNAGVKEPD